MSEKSKTNRKFTASEEYRDCYDKIFKNGKESESGVTNLEAYIQEAESQGSKHCVVPTETLKTLLEVAEAVKKDEARQPWFVIEALNKLDEARRG
jgi:hypothetical protein